MCTLLILNQCLDEHALVLAANRDELFARPWEAPRVFDGSPIVTCPIDTVAGGTWLGVNEYGVVAAITNRARGSHDPQRHSRGLLCREALNARSADASLDWAKAQLTTQDYNGCNLLLADATGAYVICHTDDQTRTQRLSAGAHIVSNRHDLDHADLEDVRQAALHNAAQGAAKLDVFLRLALGDHTVRGPTDEGLPPHSVCKHDGFYGTTCASLVWLPLHAPPRLHFAPGPPCTTPFALVPSRSRRVAPP